MGIGALSLGGTIFETVRSWWNQQQAQRVIRDSLRPGARIGTYDPGAGEAPVYGPDTPLPTAVQGLDPAAQEHWRATANELGQTDSRAWGVDAQMREAASSIGRASFRAAVCSNMLFGDVYVK